MKDTQSSSHHYTRLKEINTRIGEIHHETMLLITQQFEAGYDSPERNEAEKAIEQLHTERADLQAERQALYEQHDRELDYRLYGYRRPTGWFASPLNKLLGPLPEHSLAIEPTCEQLAPLRSYFWLALLTVTTAIGTLLGLVHILPWMAFSPYHAIYHACYWLTDNTIVAGPLAIIASVSAMRLCAKGVRGTNYATDGKLWDNLAMNEEQWFRRGAETWTVQQRFTSCAAFGVMHVVNIIYPIASILVVGFVLGGATTMVYLAEYRRSQDSVQATLAATKLHAAYNRFAIIYMVVAVAIMLGISFS